MLLTSENVLVANAHRIRGIRQSWMRKRESWRKVL